MARDLPATSLPEQRKSNNSENRRQTHIDIRLEYVYIICRLFITGQVLVLSTRLQPRMTRHGIEKPAMNQGRTMWEKLMPSNHEHYGHDQKKALIMSRRISANRRIRQDEATTRRIGERAVQKIDRRCSIRQTRQNGMVAQCCSLLLIVAQTGKTWSKRYESGKLLIVAHCCSTFFDC